MEKVRWGVLSTANIGMSAVIPAMQQGELCQVDAIASRDAASAQAAAQRLGIPRAHSTYEALLADSEIEAVYIPLPNHLHVTWALAALEAGKHVLCEKPIALTAVEAQTLADTAAKFPDLKVMEAFMYRFHPQWQRARELVRQGAIGDLRTVHTIFTYFLDDPANVRNMADIGGGALYDIGCYATSFARFLFESEPEQVVATIERDPTFKTDRLTSAMMQFSRGIATFTVSTQLNAYQRVHIMGTKGHIELEIPVNAPTDAPTRLWLETAGASEAVTFPVCNQYTLQGDAFARAILEHTSAPITLADTLGNMRTIDALFASGLSGSWVAVEPGR